VLVGGPRLAGQGEAYLVAQLVAFKRGERPDPTEAMNTTAASLSDQDIKTAARYLAGLTPGSPR
jgi:cytochrome c553